MYDLSAGNRFLFVCTKTKSPRSRNLGSIGPVIKKNAPKKYVSSQPENGGQRPPWALLERHFTTQGRIGAVRHLTAAFGGSNGG